MENYTEWKDLTLKDQQDFKQTYYRKSVRRKIHIQDSSTSLLRLSSEMPPAFETDYDYDAESVKYRLPSGSWGEGKLEKES